MKKIILGLMFLAGFGLLFFGSKYTSHHVSVLDAAELSKTNKTKKSMADTVETWEAPDQKAAKQRAMETVPFISAFVDECLLCRQQTLRDKGLKASDIEHKYVLLESPIIKKTEDHYGPVRFLHSKHAALVNDCAVCHHYRPAQKNASETTRCSACHQEPFRKDHPERVGLKAAYHMNCIGCHQKMNQGPVDCKGCHQKNVPDHKKLVTFTHKPSPSEVTKECLSCHKQAGEDMLSSVHWLWKGRSPYTMNHRKEVMQGKAKTTINNFCIATPSNEPLCTSCHAGYGWKDDSFDFKNKANIDCLVCHDTTGTYKKGQKDAGLPEPTVDLKHVAENVGHTSRKTCGT
jgi:hypothetical protein